MRGVVRPGSARRGRCTLRAVKGNLGDSFSRVGSPRGPRQARPRQKPQCFAVVEVTIRNLTVRQQHRRTKLEWTEQRETINYDEARLYSPASPSPLSTDIFYVTVSFIDERFLRS
jgi:hypothetical protein